MKNILKIAFSFYFLLSTFYLFSQVPQKFNYQGIARDAKGNPMAKQQLALKLSVLPTSDATAPEYEEIQHVLTNEFGLYTLQIGNGTPVTGEMKAVKWETGNKYIKVAIDPKGGSDFVDAGTTQLLSVPYAIYADKAGMAKNTSGDRTRTVSSNATHVVGDVNFLTKFTGLNVIGKSQVFDNGTNVGIGITNPLYKLHLQTQIGNSDILIRTLDGNASSSLRLRNSSGEEFGFNKFGPSATGTFMGISRANMAAINNFVTGPLVLNSGGDIALGNTVLNTQLARIFVNGTSGNVGIGTLTPSAKLEVIGQIKITGGTPAAGKILMSDATGLASWQAVSGLDSQWAIIGNNIYNNNLGNVGIGTSTPYAKFDVNGDALINGVTIGRGAGNDSINTAFGFKALASNISLGSNTAIGYKALNTNTTGHLNTANGFSALEKNTTGENNTAIGGVSLMNNITGNCNTALGQGALEGNAIGSYNTATGVYALLYNIEGSFNTANGFFALGSNISGNDNTAIGVYALQGNYSGNYNIANGNYALRYNSTGCCNTANGVYALESNGQENYNTANGFSALRQNHGSNNTANGAFALDKNTSGFYNTASGVYALSKNTIGGSNTANGYEALYSNINGHVNTANGANSLHNNTTGSSNTANGVSALYFNTIGGYNVANGYEALYSNTNGDYNVANGVRSLKLNTIGSGNTANGSYALYNNTFGDLNTAIGRHALYNNTVGSSNTAIGSYALVANTTGSFNTANGYHAFRFNTTGSHNTGIGDSAGFSQLVYDNCTFVGTHADASMSGLSNATAIGANAIVGASNCMVLGSTNVKVGIGISSPTFQLQLSTNSAAKPTSSTWTISSDARLKTVDGTYTRGLADVLKLNTVKYHYNKGNARNLPTEEQGFGFVAQELQLIYPEAVKENADGYLSVDFHPVLVSYINAFKELNTKSENQATEIELLKKQNSKIELLEKQNELLIKRLEALENK